MAIIGCHKGGFTSVDQLWDHYSIRFGKERSYIYKYEKEIREIMELCFIRMKKKGVNPV